MTKLIRLLSAFVSVGWVLLASVTSASGAPSCYAVPSGLVDWWRAEANTLDQIGTNTGTLSGGVTYDSGMVGLAFVVSGNSAAVRLQNTPSLQLQDFTIETWIRRASAASVSQSGTEAQLFCYGSGGYGLGLNNDGTVFLTKVDVNNVLVNGGILDTNFHHLAVTKAGTTVVFYVDGVAIPAPPYYDTFGFSTTPAIGARGDYLSSSFNGWIDEVSVYDRALAAAEVQGIYVAGSAGKCVAPALPSIISQPPVTQTLPAGTTAILGVTAVGSPPLAYQWLFNGNPLPGATGNPLVITNAQPANGGTYSVVITNPVGSIQSSNSVLVVLQATNCDAAPSGLANWWRAELNTFDQAGTNNGTIAGNVTYAPGLVGQAFAFGGSGSAVRLQNTPSLQSQDFTIETWIRRASASIVSQGGTEAQLFCYGSGGYGLGLNNDGTVFLTQVDVTNVKVNGGITDTNFHHLAVSKVGTSVVFYVDGVAIPAAPFNQVFGFSTSPAIGARGDSLSSAFYGFVDEMSFYNRALTAAEVQGIYLASSAGKCLTYLPPTIVAQPPSTENIGLGGTATIPVTAVGSLPLSYQWFFNGTPLPGQTNNPFVLANAQPVNSGNFSVLVSNPGGSVLSSNCLLTVVAPTNCVTAPQGLVDWWRGEGNALDQNGPNNGSLSGNTSYGNGEVGQAFVFNGGGAAVQLNNSSSLQLQNFTIETWIQRASANSVSLAGSEAELFCYGQGGYGLGMNNNGTVFLTQVGIGSVLVNGGLVDTNFHHLAVTKTGNNVVFYVDGVGIAAPPYDPGFFFSSNPAIGARGDNLASSFYGRMDEVSVYNRALTASEIQTIYHAGSGGKCSTIAPTIISQPQSQTVQVGGTVTFNVAASGTAPFSYQWAKNGTPLPGVTTTSLVLTNVQSVDSGNYSAVVSNSYGTATSSNAVLTVVLPPAALALKNESAASGNYVIVPVTILANGNENAVGFSVTYDATLLSFVSVSAGAGTTGAALLLNTNLVPSGRVGLALALPSGTTIPAGTQEVAEITFLTVVTNTPVSTSVAFGDSPIARQLTDEHGQVLPATYASGTISIAAAQLSADVFPRPNGDGQVNISDWVLIGRYVAALDSPTNANEFQRADCAPRAHGDGLLTVIDWVQAGRYAAGLDPLTVLGGSGTNGPVAPPPGPRNSPQGLSRRVVQVLNQQLDQDTSGTISVVLYSQGNENALQFSLSFDPTALTYVSASLGSNVVGGTLNLNAQRAGSGLLGVVLGLPIGTSFSAGINELLKVNFKATEAAPGGYAVALTDQVLTRQISDPAAMPVPATYASGMVTINEPPNLVITRADPNIMLSWPSTATGYALQQSTNSITTPGGWTTISPTTSTNNGTISVTLPITSANTFYRLYHP